MEYSYKAPVTTTKLFKFNSFEEFLDDMKEFAVHKFNEYWFIYIYRSNYIETHMVTCVARLQITQEIAEKLTNGDLPIRDYILNNGKLINDELAIRDYILKHENELVMI